MELTRRKFITSSSFTLTVTGTAAWAGNGLNRGYFGEFTRSLNVQPHGYALINDPTGAAPEPIVERFEVRSGDCHFNGGWSDCDNNRERSELRERGSQSAAETSAWYGWWFYVPQNWPDVFPTKTVLGQFHQDGSHPLWMFLNYDGGLVLDDQSTGRTTRRIPLIDHKKFASQWHRIEIQAKWTTSSSGLLKVWVNNDLKFEHHGGTMTAETVYFRFGVYRSFISRYKSATGQQALPTQIAMYSGVRKASTRDGLKVR